MIEKFLLALMPGVIVGAFVVLFSFIQFDEENQDIAGRQYRPIISPTMLPVAFAAAFGVELWIKKDIVTAIHGIMPSFLSIFITLTIFYSVMAVLLPVMRRYISARTCATLWIVPNFIYMLVTARAHTSSARIILNISDKTLAYLGAIWLTGFVAVMCWNVANHIIFKRHLFKNAHPATDSRVLAIWDDEVANSGIKPKFLHLVVSPDINAPLSIGSGKKATVILPDVQYTDSELHLIMRHEIVHLSRDDSGAKFLLVFCTATCWFNPLMWYAMSKCAEDIELSCDETVLLNTDNEIRRKYADLILNNAGDSRGFTTCLSASASCLRYRLKSIVTPAKRHSGIVVLGLVVTMLFSSYGTIALAYDHGTAKDYMYMYSSREDMSLSYISRSDDYRSSTIYKCDDINALLDYLENLETVYLTSSVDPRNEEKGYYFLFNTPSGIVNVNVKENEMHIGCLSDRNKKEDLYLPQGIDWDKLDRIVISYPALTAVMHGDREYDTQNVVAWPSKIVETTGGQNTVKSQYTEEDYDSPGIFGYNLDKYKLIDLQFTDQPTGPYTITIYDEDWNVHKVHEMEPDQLSFTTDIFPARYIISGQFKTSIGREYDVEFCFNVFSPDNYAEEE